MWNSKILLMAEILHQLRLVVYPIIYRYLQGFIHPRGLAGFLPSIVFLMLWFSEIPLASWDGESSMFAKVSYVPIMKRCKIPSIQSLTCFSKAPKKNICIYIYIQRAWVEGQSLLIDKEKMQKPSASYNAIISKALNSMVRYSLATLSVS